jgi:hypothetical protein
VLSFTTKPILLSVVMQSVVMLNVVAPPPNVYIRNSQPISLQTLGLRKQEWYITFRWYRLARD